MPRITIELDEEELRVLRRRAKSNFFSLRELIEDIVRRSVASSRKGTKPLKIDDKLVGIFSRQRSGRKKKTAIIKTGKRKQGE